MVSAIQPERVSVRFLGDRLVLTRSFGSCAIRLALAGSHAIRLIPTLFDGFLTVLNAFDPVPVLRIESHFQARFRREHTSSRRTWSIQDAL